MQAHGPLQILTNHLHVKNAANNEDIFEASENSSVKLYYDNGKKLETTSTGVSVTGNVVVSGMVDGRDKAADGTKLDTIETSATADQTA